MPQPRTHFFKTSFCTTRRVPLRFLAAVYFHLLSCQYLNEKPFISRHFIVQLLLWTQVRKGESEPRNKGNRGFV
jgi:hypothetical protein